MPRELHTQIEIDAPAERVWNTLADLDGHARWNPLLRRLSGRLDSGSQLRVSVRLSWWFRMVIHPLVLRCDPPHVLQWRGSLIIPGLFEGTHTFHIEPNGEERTILAQSETFKGFLVPIILPIIRGIMRRGFSEMNLALKNVAESA